ncbi:MAG: hypothetical protein Q9195_003104 [Heterodermia aff. obscurata]
MPTKAHQPTLSQKPQNDNTEEDLDDYMSMAITEPVQKTFETSAQRRLRKQREAEARSRPPPASETPPSKPEPLPPTSKGFKMLSALGYKAGSALGAEGNPNALLQPIGVEVKEDKGGIGHESERKRKVREEWEKVEGVEKKMKADVGDYRVRVAKEREERRAEGMWWGAMKVLEGLEEGRARDENRNKEDIEGIDPAGVNDRKKRPIKTVKLLFRPLIRDRVEKERERRMQYDLHQSLTRNPKYDDPEEDKQDKLAFGNEEEELEEDDEELEEYLTLEPAERLERVVIELRAEWRYCFWCKYQYQDKQMTGCPGADEDSHG